MIQIGRRAHRLRLIALAFASWGVVVSCAGGGGGSDVPNDLSGTVLSASGEPASGTRVLLRSASATPSRPGPVWETVSDGRGEFHLPLVPDTGSWLVEWRDSATGSGASRLLRAEWIVAERIPPVRLAKWGALRGTLATTSAEVSAQAVVVIPGLLLSSKVDSNGSWRIDDIPEGSYQPRVEGIANGATTKTDSVSIVPGKESVLAPVAVLDHASRRIWKGVLRSWDGYPVAGARLWLFSIDRSDSVRCNCVSDDSGRIAWILPDTGRGVVRISTATAGWTGNVNFGDSSASRPRPLADTIVMQSLATLSGTLIPGAGPQTPPLAGFTIRIGAIGRTAKVGTDGRWSFDLLPLGSWKLFIEDSLGKTLDSLQASAATFGFPTIGPMVAGPVPEMGWSQLRCADAHGTSLGRCLARTYPDSAWRSFNQAQRTSLLVSNHSWETVADPSGRFAVARQSKQSSHLTVLSADRRLGAFAALPTEATTLSLSALDTVRTLKVALGLPSSAPPEWSMVGFRLVLVGTGRYSPLLHNLDPAVFDSLAPGTYQLLAVPAATDIPLLANWQLTIGSTDIDTVVRPSLSQLEDSTAWKASGEISLQVPDLTTSWKDIPVRVVLDGKLDMQTWTADGADLRVFDANGEPARFWVSQWDEASGHAEMWIRVDTLHPKNTMKWTYRQGNPAASRQKRHHVDSVFLAKDWLALWDAATGKSLLAGGYPFRGSLSAGAPAPLGRAFSLTSTNGLEAGIAAPGGDSGFTFLASFRFDTVPNLANIVRVSSDSVTRSWAASDDSFRPLRNRLVLGERHSDTVHAQTLVGKGGPAFATLEEGAPMAVAVGFLPAQTTLHRVGSPSDPSLYPLTLATAGLPASAMYLEIGQFDRAPGFAGTMSFPRLSRGEMDAQRLVLESYNLQASPSWIQVVRHR